MIYNFKYNDLTEFTDLVIHLAESRRNRGGGRGCMG